MSDLVPAGPYRAPVDRLRGEEEEARFMVQQELAPGERLVWAGKPRQGVRLVPADVYLIPAGLVLAGFPLLMSIAVLVLAGPAAVGVLFQIAPFFAFGLYLAGFRFLVDARRRAQTYYGLTDRRALIVNGRDHHAISIDLAALPPGEVVDVPGGFGTIHFGVPSKDTEFPLIGRLHRRLGWGPSLVDAASASRSEHPSFEELRDARVVLEHLREVQMALTAGPPPPARLRVAEESAVALGPEEPEMEEEESPEPVKRQRL
ncbi:MAG TPA: hypothetical protein VLS89_03900 [Candidatus Nanopelagicales bacterium]|nr:hypothetical protein [Candidatus Nanopelagicales bacterium]